MTEKTIYITGPFGAPIIETARQIAKEENRTLYILDEEIERREKWSVRRMVMMHGEHAYRNAELDALKALSDNSIVIACGDGILYDEDCRGIIMQGQLVIAGLDLSEDDLWERACRQRDTYHAFMSMPAEAGSEAEEKKREKFHQLIGRQKKLFEQYNNKDTQEA